MAGGRPATAEGALGRRVSDRGQDAQVCVPPRPNKCPASRNAAAEGLEAQGKPTQGRRVYETVRRISWNAGQKAFLHGQGITVPDARRKALLSTYPAVHALSTVRGGLLGGYNGRTDRRAVVDLDQSGGPGRGDLTASQTPTPLPAPCALLLGKQLKHHACTVTDPGTVGGWPGSTGRGGRGVSLLDPVQGDAAPSYRTAWAPEEGAGPHVHLPGKRPWSRPGRGAHVPGDGWEHTGGGGPRGPPLRDGPVGHVAGRVCRVSARGGGTGAAVT